MKLLLLNTYIYLHLCDWGWERPDSFSWVTCLFCPQDNKKNLKQTNKWTYTPPPPPKQTSHVCQYKIRSNCLFFMMWMQITVVLYHSGYLECQDSDKELWHISEKGVRQSTHRDKELEVNFHKASFMKPKWKKPFAKYTISSWAHKRETNPAHA